MSDLQWLRDLGEGRTKGPWYYPGDGRLIVKDKKGGWPIEMVYKDAPADDPPFELDFETSKKNCAFIAAAGTLWEPMLEVIEASKAYIESLAGYEESEELIGMQQTLDALQAARKEVE